MTAVQEITVQEAARRVRRSPETVRRWIWSGRLPAVKRGNTYYVDVMRLEGLVVEMGSEAHQVAGTTRSGALAAWLEELDRWQASLDGPTQATASDLVIEDRRARR